MAAIFAYWVRPALDQRATLAALGGHYTDVVYDVPRDPRTAESRPRLIPRLLLQALGIDFFANIVELEIYNPTDGVLKDLERLHQLRALTLHGTDFTTAAGARALKRLPHLRSLTLAGYEMNDATQVRFQRALPECVVRCDTCDSPAPSPVPPISMPLAVSMSTTFELGALGLQLKGNTPNEPASG